MTASYLDYRDKSIKYHDGRLVIVFKLMIKVGRELYADQVQILQALDKWNHELLFSAPGLFAVELNGYWETPDGHRVLNSLLAGASAFSSTFDLYIPAQVMDEIVGFKGDRHIDIQVSNIKEWIALVSDLVN